jgi:hypothetical protein
MTARCDRGPVAVRHVGSWLMHVQSWRWSFPLNLGLNLPPTLDLNLLEIRRLGLRVRARVRAGGRLKSRRVFSLPVGPFFTRPKLGK